jgi:hypothetical protein
MLVQVRVGSPELALTYTFNSDLSTHSIEEALNSLVEHVTCKLCHQTLKEKIRDVVTKWSMVKVSGYKMSLCIRLLRVEYATRDGNISQIMRFPCANMLRGLALLRGSLHPGSQVHLAVGYCLAILTHCIFNTADDLTLTMVIDIHC